MSKAILWQPSNSFTADSNLKDYEKWLSQHLNIQFDSYESLRQWSVDNIALFWETIWQYYNVIAHNSYDKVVQLPSERAGILMVFRVFEKMSYGLVLKAQRPLAVLDELKNP